MTSSKSSCSLCGESNRHDQMMDHLIIAFLSALLSDPDTRSSLFLSL